MQPLDPVEPEDNRASDEFAMTPSPPSSTRTRRSDHFYTTRWTVVLAARGNSPEAREALSALCEAYYEPVCIYLTRALRDPVAARDVAHDFFANLLEGDRFAQVKREGGKFRAYLSGALKHFLSHRRAFERRVRRGSGVDPFPLDAGPGIIPPLADGQAIPPDMAFDRAWATTLLARALSALRAECESEGAAAQFDRLKPWLTGEAAHGAQVEMARDLQLDPGALKAAVHRLRRRFRHFVKAEVASTLSPPADVDEEMRALFVALAG